MRLRGMNRSEAYPHTVGNLYTITEITCATSYTLKTSLEEDRLPLGMDANYLDKADVHGHLRFWTKTTDGNAHTMEYTPGGGTANKMTV